MNSFHHFLVYPPYWEFLPRRVLEWTKSYIPASKLILDLEHLGEIEQEIFETRKTRSSEDAASFLGSLGKMLEVNKEEPWLVNGLLQDIREMLAGGSDTSANTLAYHYKQTLLYFFFKFY